MRYVGRDAVTKYNGGGVYSNLLNSCPPLQIDGNFGGGAAMAEMLLQSHDGFIELLPALPAAWPEGRVSGLVARGNFVIDMQWQHGRLTDVRIRSRSGGSCKVRYQEQQVQIHTVPGKSYTPSFN